MRRLAQQGEDAAEQDTYAVNQVLAGMMAGSGEGDSFTITNVSGIAVGTNKKENMGRDFKSRDFFTAALRGNNFVSGTSIGVSTNTPSLFFSTPIRTADGKVVGVINNTADNPPDVQQLVDAARDRVGSGARGVLLDEQGLVIASSFDPSWMLRPVMPLDPNALAAMAKDQRWGKKPAPTP